MVFLFYFCLISHHVCVCEKDPNLDLAFFSGGYSFIHSFIRDKYNRSDLWMLNVNECVLVWIWILPLLGSYHHFMDRKYELITKKNRLTFFFINSPDEKKKSFSKWLDCKFFFGMLTQDEMKIPQQKKTATAMICRKKRENEFIFFWQIKVNGQTKKKIYIQLVRWPLVKC